MKNKLIALISAAAMLLSMASAVFAAPEIPGVTIQSGTAYINGTVWDDPDGDDKYTAGTDTYIVDVAVSLLDADTRETVLMSSTDNNGYYSFETEPGDYILRFVLPEEYQYHSMRTVEAGMGIGDYADILGNRVAEFEETVADASVVEATEIPTPSDIPIPSQMPELNKTEHYAYVVGYPDGMIKPENNITRQEVASIFFRLLTDATRDSFYSKANGFEDVTADMWSNIAISTMVQAGIIKGYDEKSFKPANNITRAEFATIAAKFDSGSYEGENKFNDIDGHWAAEYINRAAQKGWISGYENGSFRPDAYITRAEAMTLINNVLERHALESGMLEGMASWADNTPDKWYYIPVQEATNSHYYEKNEDGYETWTELRETRDWSELEK